MLALRLFVVFFIIAWTVAGAAVMWHYQALFGPSADNPSETAGARSFNLPTLVSVWIGGYGLAIYFFCL